MKIHSHSPTCSHQPQIYMRGAEVEDSAEAVFVAPDRFERATAEMAKVQLHLHLEGAVRPESILEEAARQNLEPPAASVEELKAKISMKPGEGLLAFLKKFDPFRFMFADVDSLKRLAYEAVEDNAKENVRYVELRMNPLKSPDRVDIGGVLDAILEGINSAEKDLGVKANFIVSLNRSYSVDSAMEVVKAAVERKENGIVGIDLAGDEINHPPEKFTEVFKYARDNGLRVTVHAGEAVGPSSIEGAIDHLKAERIGHGVRLHEDKESVARVRDEQIHLEMCPHSNYLLNIVPGMKAYPIKYYTNEGISCSLSTDDPGIFDVTLTQEHNEQARQNGFSLQQLQQLNLNAARAAFLPMVEKETLIAELEASYRKINSELLAEQRPASSLPVKQAAHFACHHPTERAA